MLRWVYLSIPIVFMVMLAGCDNSNSTPTNNAEKPIYSALDLAALTTEAQALVQAFAGQLKPQLKQALESGGPAHAISVCSEQAPAIAKDLSQSNGWSVRRVSLKTRNATMAEPDDWERDILMSFDRRQAGGEPAAKISAAELVDNEFRFMKAQGVEPLCLVCHGEDVAPEAEAALMENYPNDLARGYQLGDIRGAFSLSKKVF